MSDVARARVQDAGHVRVDRCELPEELPEGVFDLIVCADLRCYWGRRRS